MCEAKWHVVLQGDDEEKESKPAAAAPSKVGTSSSQAVVVAEAGGSSQPAAQTAPSAAAPASRPSHQYSSELLLLHKEFPEFDESLVLGLLEDQGGDVLDVRHSLRVSTPLLSCSLWEMRGCWKRHGKRSHQCCMVAAERCDVDQFILVLVICGLPDPYPLT